VTGRLRSFLLFGEDVLQEEPEPCRRFLFGEDLAHRGEDVIDSVQAEHLVRVFELDHPATQAARQRALRRSGRSLARVSFVPVVSGADDPGRALAAAGFTAGASALVVRWRRVTVQLWGGGLAR